MYALNNVVVDILIIFLNWPKTDSTILIVTHICRIIKLTILDDAYSDFCTKEGGFKCLICPNYSLANYKVWTVLNQDVFCGNGQHLDSHSFSLFDSEMYELNLTYLRVVLKNILLIHCQLLSNPDSVRL